MLTFLAGKCAEYDVLLPWLKGRLKDLVSRELDHRVAVRHLQEQVGKLFSFHDELRRLVQSKDSTLQRRALPNIHTIEFWITVASEYLAALERQGSSEKALRNLLLAEARALGFYWLSDLVVSLNGPLATLPAVAEAPVIFAPPHWAQSLLDLPGLYHEFGHIVFEQVEAGKPLAEAVSSYYREVRRKGGPWRRQERQRKIDYAEAYWTELRLNELFSDVFATLVCGPAYYASCVDMAVTARTDPYRLDPTDEHPPAGARVYAASRTLVEAAIVSPVTKLIADAWESYARKYDQAEDYKRTCSVDLLNCLVRSACTVITQRLPECTYKDGVGTAVDESEASNRKSRPLRVIVNEGMQVLLTDPTSFESWLEGTAIGFPQD